MFEAFFDFTHVTFACEHQNTNVLAAVVKREYPPWPEISIYNCDYSRDVFEAFIDFAHVTFACEHRNTNVLNWELTHKILYRNINTT